MSRALWRNRSLCSVLLLLVLLGIAAVRTRAQSPSDSDDDADDDATPAPTLNVTVIFSQDGNAQVSFFAFGQPSTDTDFKAALESSLNCTLQDTSPRRSPKSQFYNGSCTPAFQRSSMLRESRIAIAPLRKYALDHHIELLTLNVRLPDVDIAETDPPAPPPALFDKMPPSVQHMLQLNHMYSWHTDHDIPDFVTARFGLSSRSVTRAGYTLVGVLLVPALLIFWMGRKALSSEAQDKAVVWFTYMRYLQWTLNLSMLAWWSVAFSLHSLEILQFLSLATPLAPMWKYSVVATLINWVPPAILCVLGLALSHPVQEKLRGLTWTRGELALQGVYSFCASLLPIALFLSGITAMAKGSVRSGVLWMIVAFAVAIVASRALQKLLGMQPQALTTGDLRDRAFAMARQLNVKLQQVYVVPSGKGQMANAFARRGNVISFTDFLLQRMNRREVNYVLGHEMTHLKLGHPGKLAIAAVITYFVAISSLSFATPLLHLSPFLRYTMIVAIVILVRYFWSRRFEYAADAGAVEVTGDPQAAISALFKISQLNMMPIHWSHWSEKWLTHPSSLRRAQAIARKAGIPVEQVPEIARSAAAADDHYVLPATIAPDAKVHSSHKKQGGSLVIAFSMLGLLIFTPAAFGFLANRFFHTSPLKALLLVVGFAVTIAMYYAFGNWLPPIRNPQLVRSLKTKLAREGILADAWDGVFVGFAPAAAPRSYELNTNWDIGCFFLRSDRLCYWGEETKFSLRPDQITAITFAPGSPALVRPWRIYFAWKDDELGTSGVFNIGCLNGASTVGLRSQSSQLAERLKVWWKTSPAVRPLPAPLAALRSPQIGAVTGASPKAYAKPAKVFTELLWTGVYAVLGAILCGLPFHFVAFLFSQLNQSFGRLGGFHSPGSGWYVVAVALVVRFIALIPAIRYNDVAIVTLAPSPSQFAQVAKKPNVQAQPPATERDKVLTH